MIQKELYSLKDKEDLFSFDRSQVTKTTSKLDVRASKKIKATELRVSKRDAEFEKIMEELNGFPSTKEYQAIKTNGTTDCGSIFTYALEHWGIIEDMYLATWTISKTNITRLKNAVESGRLKKLTMVFSSTFKPTSPAIYSSLMSALKPFPQVKLKEVNTHAKTFSITNNKDYITVSGSANWSENPRIENFLIINDVNLYNHHKDWMSELADIK